MRELFDKITLYSIVLTLVLLAIPYGTVEPWWEALFILWIYLLTGFRIVSDIFFKEKFYPASLSLPLIALAGFAYIQSLSILSLNLTEVRAISADPTASWFFSLKLLAYILLFELIRKSLAGYKSLSILLHSLIFLCVAIAVFGIVRELFLGGQAEFFLEALKPGAGFAQFINRNHFAMLMNIALGIVIGFVFNKFHKEKGTFYLSLAAVLLGGLALSLSRGGIFALLVQTFVAIIVFSTGKHSRDGREGEEEFLSVKAGKSQRLKLQLKTAATRVGLIVLILITISVGVIWIGGEKLSNRFEKLPEDARITSEQANADMFRMDFWRHTLAVFRDNPIVGAGFGGYPIAIHRYFESSGRMELREAHNEYLEYLADGGVIGLIIGIWFLITLWMIIKRQTEILSNRYLPHFYGALISLTGVAVHSLIDFGLHMAFIAAMFFCLLAMITVKGFEKTPDKLSAQQIIS